MSTDISSVEGLEPNTLLHEDGVFQHGFTQIPNQVLYSRHLSAAAKTLYAILLSYSWKEDRCFPGYARLCDHMQLSEKAVRKCMRELEAVKLLRQKRRGLGLTNLYTLLSLRNAALGAERSNAPIRERSNLPVRNGSAARFATGSKTGEEDSKNLTQHHHDTDPSNLRRNAWSEGTIGNDDGDGVRLPNGRTEEEDAIALYLEGFSRELGDVEHTKSNVTQALNIWRWCQAELVDVDLAFYLDVLQSARDLVRKRHVTKRNDDGESPNRMPYFFKTIRDYVGLPDGKTPPPRP